MQNISYSASEKKRLVTFEWQGRGNGTVRALKMLRPICMVCQIGRDQAPRWWASCDHEPYWSLKPKVIKTPVYENDEDGDMILKDTEIRTKMIRVPNITEVVISVRSNDGRGVALANERKGFSGLPEAGLAPMCQMYSCGKAWPTVRTEEWGDYCSEAHAKICAADALEIKFTINDPRIQRQEMAEVSI